MKWIHSLIYAAVVWAAAAWFLGVASIIPIGVMLWAFFSALAAFSTYENDDSHEVLALLSSLGAGIVAVVLIPVDLLAGYGVKIRDWHFLLGESDPSGYLVALRTTLVLGLGLLVVWVPVHLRAAAAWILKFRRTTVEHEAS